MTRLSKKTQEARKYQAEQDTIAATRINDPTCFFHAAPLLYCLEDVRSPLRSVFFLFSATPRAAKMTGFCGA